MQSIRALAALLTCATLVAVLQTRPGLGNPDGRDAPGPDSRDLARGMSGLFQDVSATVGPAVVAVTARSERGLSKGSGVILRSDGLVVTNHHVIEGADDIRVVLSDGSWRSAELRGTDPDTDLAVLAIDGDGYTVATLRAGEPAVGEWVLAFGNPRGLGTSVTFGIIGGRKRSGLGVATFESFLQTDAAINPGNSGGPLVDLDGNVVGINTAKGMTGGEDDGLGFAIPAAMVRLVVDGVVQDGEVRRGWLGIRMRELTARGARRQGLGGEPHVLVREVLPDSPAERAGLEEGDVLLAIDGAELRDSRALLDLVAARVPGSVVRLDFLRDGEREQLEIELGRRP